MEIHLWHVGALSGAAGSYVLCTDRENTGKKNQTLSPCLLMMWKWQRRSCSCSNLSKQSQPYWALKMHCLCPWPLKTRILQSMAANEEDSTITRDVKAAIRGRNVIFYFFCWSDPWHKTIMWSEPWYLWSVAPLVILEVSQDSYNPLNSSPVHRRGIPAVLRWTSYAFECTMNY